MTTIYFKDADGKRVYIEVEDEFAAAYHESRLVINRNNDQEEYWRDKKLGNLNDHDEELTANGSNPEEVLVATDEQAELRARLTVGLKSLTVEQLTLVKMLRAGKSVTEIAKHLGISKAAVSQMRNRIQEKIKKYLK